MTRAPPKPPCLGMKSLLPSIFILATGRLPRGVAISPTAISTRIACIRGKSQTRNRGEWCRPQSPRPTKSVQARPAQVRSIDACNVCLAVFQGESHRMSVTQQTSESAQQHWMELEHKYYQGTFKRAPLVFVRGEGTRVWDADGHDYLDLVAGIAVNVLGHCHPAVVSAIQEQATKLVHVSNLYYNIPQIQLAEQLGLLSGGMRSFFSNSGAEANEGAIKLARKYGRLHRNGAYEIISMDRSFHGRTLATTSATGQKKYKDTWLPLADGFKQVPFNDLDALKAAVTDKTAGILIEAVQGEGGIHPVTPDYWQGLRAFCDANDLVLIADEVQAGVGRTGKFFSWKNLARNRISSRWRKDWRVACPSVPCWPRRAWISLSRAITAPRSVAIPSPAPPPSPPSAPSWGKGCWLR